MAPSSRTAGPGLRLRPFGRRLAAPMARRRKSVGLTKGLLISGVAALLMLGSLELFARAFVPVRHVGPAFSVHDPVQGKRLRPSFEATRMTPEFEFKLHTNSLGMRDPEPEARPKGTVVIIGDSFTLGYGVSDHETYAALVRERLEQSGLRAPVLNMGIGNNGNGRWLKVLEAEVPTYTPRVIVLQLMLNDFSDNLREGLYRLDHAGKLEALPIPPPGLGRQAQAFVDAIPGLGYSHLVGLAWTAAAGQGPVFTPQLIPDPNYEAEGDALTYALLEAAVKKSQALGAKVLVLLVEVEGPRRVKVAAILGAAGVRYVDVPAKRNSPKLYYERDGHWNASGHRFAADLITPAVVDLLE